MADITEQQMNMIEDIDPLLSYHDASIKFEKKDYLDNIENEQSCIFLFRYSDSETIRKEYALTCCHIVCYTLQYLLSGKIWEETNELPDTEFFAVHYEDSHSLLVHMREDGSGDVYQSYWQERQGLYKISFPNIRELLTYDKIYILSEDERLKGVPVTYQYSHEASFDNVHKNYLSL